QLFPEHSAQYTTATAILSDFFSNLSTHLAAHTTILVSSSPRVHEHTPAESFAFGELKARKEIPLSSHPYEPASTTGSSSSGTTTIAKDKPKKPTVPLTRVPRFFDSKAKCEAQTGACSAHGKCVQRDHPVPGRWSCRCESSV